MSGPLVGVVAMQDELHRIIDQDSQWKIQHRAETDSKWRNDAFCVTRIGVEFFLACEAERNGFSFMIDIKNRKPFKIFPGLGRRSGYMPLHHWPVPPRLQKYHRG